MKRFWVAKALDWQGKVVTLSGPVCTKRVATLIGKDELHGSQGWAFQRVWAEVWANSPADVD